MNFKKMSAKALSVFMCLIMLFSVVAPAVSATGSNDTAEKPVFNYVSLGDSMTNGYGSDGYAQGGHNGGLDIDGDGEGDGYDVLDQGEVGHYGKDSYANKFADYLSLAYDVKHTKLATSAMLSRDLLYLVGAGKYVDDGYAGFTHYVGKYWANVDEDYLEQLQALYIEKLTEADLVTIALGNAEFGAYIMDNLMDIIGFQGATYDPTFVNTQLEVIMNNTDAKLVEKVVELRDQLYAELPEMGEFGEEQIKDIANLFAHTILDFCYNYTQILDTIVELNPDVEIIVVGVMNAVNGLKFEIDGEEYDMGDYMEIVLDIVNTHVSTYVTAQKANDPAYENATVYYAETADVEVVADTYQKGLNNLTRERFFEAIVGKYNGTEWEPGMIFDAMELPGEMLWDVSTIYAYEEDELGSFFALVANYMAEGMSEQYATIMAQKTISLIQTYLGFEKAIIEASKGASLTLTDLVVLGNLDVVFPVIQGAMGYDEEDVAAALQNSIATKDEAYVSMCKMIADMLNGYDSDVWNVGKTHYYNLYKFVYTLDTIDELYSDLQTLTTEELEAKFSAALYEKFYVYNASYEELNEIGEANQGWVSLQKSRADRWAKELVEECQLAMESAYGQYEFLFFAPIHMSDVLVNGVFEIVIDEDTYDFNMKGLLNLFGRCIIGTGIGVHPSAAGHEALFNAVRTAYANQYTTTDKTVDDFRDLCEYIYNNYEEIYAFLYNEAYNAGKIDEIVYYLEASKAYITYAKDFALAYDEYFRGSDVAPQIVLTANNAIKTIDAAIALVKEADVLDEATYNEFIKLLEALEVNLADIATLIKIAAEDAYEFADEYVNENIIPVIVEQLTILNNQFIKAVEAINAAHNEIKDIVENVQDAVDDFFANNGFNADYTVSKDSFYLAIGDDTYYSAILADKLGLNDAQFGTMGWDEIDSSIIAKADLITISYSESAINHFAIDQLLGYIQNYVSVDLKAEANAYVEEALNHFFGEMKPALDKDIANVIIESVQGIVSEKIDTIAEISFIADATKTELDWAGLVGEEHAKLIEGAVDAIVAEVLATGIADNFATEIEVFDLFIENLDELDPTAATLIALFGTEEIEAMFGEYATYTVKFPVVDAVAFAVESYIYNYVKFNVEYAKTVYAISAMNPNAQIVILGGYNAFDGIGMEVTIGEIVIDLGEYLNTEVKAEVDNAFDFIYGEFVNDVDAVITDKNIENALASIDFFLSCVEDIMAIEPSIAFVDAVKSFEINDELLVKIVGAANLDLAKKVIYTAKFVLVETNLYDDVLANIEGIPTVEDILPALIELESQLQNGAAELDAFVDANLAELGFTVEEIRAIVADLAFYAEIVKEEALGLKDLVDSVFEAIANTDLRFDETVIDLGEFFGDIVSGTVSVNAIMQAHAIKNVIYVDIADAETIYDTMNEGDILDFVLSYVFDATVTDLSEAGHEYVAEQIYNALNITCDHYDDDNDHYCDNLVCDEKLSECVDTNKDHKCDICGAELSACADTNKDHKCDYCGAETSKCADTNNDHKCDLCGKELTKCADANNDHKCDVCGKELTTCADANNDHKCDLCGKELSSCADANNDHNCDLCGAKLSDCADANNDHNCDLCGNKLSDCADANNDHKCDVCGKELSTCVDNDKDGKCDICGAKLGLSRTAVTVIVVASVVVVAGLGVGIFFGIKTGFFAKLFKKN